jgi:hypothetical protein
VQIRKSMGYKYPSPLPIQNRQQQFKREGGSFDFCSCQIKKETPKFQEPIQD